MLDHLTTLQKIALFEVLGKDIKKNKLKESIKPEAVEAIEVTVEGVTLSLKLTKGSDTEATGLDSKLSDRLLLRLLSLHQKRLEGNRKALDISVEIKKSLTVDTGTHGLSAALKTAISDYKGTLPKRTRSGSVRVS